MNKPAIVLILGAVFSATSAYGAGVSSLNAASIYGYGKPHALYVQKMPLLAFADTSSARQWVTDDAACASARHAARRGMEDVFPDLLAASESTQLPSASFHGSLGERLSVATGLRRSVERWKQYPARPRPGCAGWNFIYKLPCAKFQKALFANCECRKALEAL